jgi:hypothetical protein
MSSSSNRKRKNAPPSNEQEFKKGKYPAREEINQTETDTPVWCLKKAQEEKPSRQCPYLDTIDRLKDNRKNLFKNASI